MPNKQRTLRALLRKYCWFSALAVAAAPALLLAGNSSLAADNHRGNKVKIEPAVRLLFTVPVPGGPMYSFDISFVDPATQTYYLADRSNKAVDVLTAETFLTKLVPTAPFAPFAGFTPCVPAAGANDCAGPNGVVAAFPW